MSKRTKSATILAIAAVAWGAPLAHARPITYRDGVRGYVEVQDYWQEASVAYSVSGGAALGFDLSSHVRTDPRDGTEIREQTALFRWDQLVARYNGEGLQASLGTVLGVGYLWGGGHEDRSHLEFGLSADTETRRWLASVELLRGVSPQLSPIDRARLRAGVATLQGETDQLQAWLLAQFDADTIHEATRYRLGPVARLSYRNVLGELGVSADPSDLGQRSYFAAFEFTL